MSETIRDRHNQIVAYFHHESDGVVRVTDQHQNLLGRVKATGTFDEHNQRVSYQREPGLLVRRVK
jgi:murein tripeptide amidase MpaA